MIDWIQTSGLTIIVILGVAYILNHFGTMIIRRTVSKAVSVDKYASEEDEIRREDTLVSILATTFRAAVWIVAAILIVSEMGLDIGPLVAGAGVVGLALAFGAQSIIKDFISGIFVVLENQYRVGDVVELNNVTGTVKALTMRTTVLRDLDGNVHHFPNGTIEHTTNKTMDYSRINMSIGVSYNDDIDKVEKVINEVGEALAKDPVWGADIIKAPYFARVSEFDDSSVQIKIFGKTAPGKHWSVAGELRRRLKAAFDKEGIEIPFPQRVVHEGKANKK